jgi:hypothetical protein
MRRCSIGDFFITIFGSRGDERESYQLRADRMAVISGFDQLLICRPDIIRNFLLNLMPLRLTQGVSANA